MVKLTPTKDGTCLPNMVSKSNIPTAVYYKLSILTFHSNYDFVLLFNPKS